MSKNDFEKKSEKNFENFEISFRDSEIFENFVNQKFRLENFLVDKIFKNLRIPKGNFKNFRKKIKLFSKLFST